MEIKAFQLSELIQLKKFKKDFAQEPLYGNNFELFYKTKEGNFIYLLNFGVVIIAGMNEIEKSSLLKFLKDYLEDPIEVEFIDDFEVSDSESGNIEFDYDSIKIPEKTDDAIRIIMLNIGQSVAMDYYESLSLEIFKNSQAITDELEKTGALTGKKKELMKFMGRTLNVKNSIIDNLYIFDAPDIVWENEYLEKIDKGMKRTFDLKMRYQDVDYKLKIVQDNIRLFSDLLQNRENTRLEWIVIILILIEVIDTLLRMVGYKS
jgi:required for meiotic nuclear division protein 1